MRFITIFFLGLSTSLFAGLGDAVLTGCKVTSSNTVSVPVGATLQRTIPKPEDKKLHVATVIKGALLSLVDKNGKRYGFNPYNSFTKTLSTKNVEKYENRGGTSAEFWTSFSIYKLKENRPMKLKASVEVSFTMVRSNRVNVNTRIPHAPLMTFVLSCDPI